MAYGLVNDSGAREQYTALAAETNFAYPFEIFADGDLDVWLTPNGQEPNPVLDLLVLNTDYTVTGAGMEGGGDIVLVVPATAGDIITIERDVPIERLADYSVGGDFSGASINQQLDKLTMTQQQNEMVNETRQLTYFPTDELTDGDVDLPKLATDQIWTKSAAGGLIAADIEESTGWSTLRSELANDLSGTDGARIIGYYDLVRGSETVKDKLDNQVDLPVDDTTSIVADPVTPSKQMRIDVGAVSAATVRVLTMPDKDVDLTTLENYVIKQGRHIDGVYQTLGAVVIPFDNTIPQITEGAEIMTEAITPSAATTYMVVEVVAYVTSTAAEPVTVALFRDTTVNAIAVGFSNMSAGDEMIPITLKALVASGATAATTFRVRVGGTTGNIHFNGSTSGALYGGTLSSSVIITEYVS